MRRDERADGATARRNIDLSETGLLLPNGCRVTHGAGATIKRPLPGVDLEMHELYAGGAGAFGGQLGFIPFRSDYRLPRHVHMSDLHTSEAEGGKSRLLPERILALNGVALVELCGEVLVVAPGTLVDIPPGVPHTWTACPAGVRLPDGTCADGTFLMIYEYAEPTSFSPTASTRTLADAADYAGYPDGATPIAFPEFSAADVVAKCACVIDTTLSRDLTLA